jgi:hypothetical protein
MAFQASHVGYLIGSDPFKGHRKLCRLFRKDRTLIAVAKHAGVDRHTVQRWITKLTAMGYADPRTQLDTPDPGGDTDEGSDSAEE